MATRIAILVWALAAGCGGGDGPAGPGVQAADETPGADGDQDVGTPPEAAFEPRTAARLSAQQFQRSLQVATGQTWAGFERFAATMGQPDYLEVIEENLAPSVPFARLVNEAARETCGAAMLADIDTADRLQRTLLRHVELSDTTESALPAIQENLRYLLLRFHGRFIDPSDSAALDSWLALVSGPGTAQQLGSRWAATCIALVSHPDFLTY